MDPAGLILLLGFLGAASSFTYRTYGHAKAAGGLPLPAGTPQRLRQTAAVLRRQVVTDYPGLPHVARKIKTATSGRKRRAAKPPKQPKPFPFQRLLIPSSSAARTQLTGRKKQTVTTDTGNVPHRPTEGQEIRQPTRGSSHNGTSAPSGGGPASDFFHAQNRMLQEAQAGGLQSKVRAHLTLGEGFPQQAQALEVYARNLQETGQYPSYIWEPVRRAAQFLRSAGAGMAESGSAIASLAATPAGELQGKAPAREELNKA